MKINEKTLKKINSLIETRMVLGYSPERPKYWLDNGIGGVDIVEGNHVIVDLEHLGELIKDLSQIQGIIEEITGVEF